MGNDTKIGKIIENINPVIRYYIQVNEETSDHGEQKRNDE